MARRPLTAEQRKAYRAEQEARLADLHGQLTEKSAAIANGPEWAAWLSFASGFHRYSFKNTMLIMMQRPGATAVAGYDAWKARGRQVRRGETGIRVDVDGKLTTIFDISQTDGPPLPTPPKPQRLTGQGPDGLWDKLAGLCAEHGYIVTKVPAANLDGADGRTSITDRTVTVRDDVDDAHAVRTLAHELGHVLLHNDDPEQATSCRGTAEVEAESVAYLVANAHGLDTSDYTFAYIAAWAHSAADQNDSDVAATIRATGQRVLAAADTILTRTTGADQTLSDSAADTFAPLVAATAELRDATAADTTIATAAAVTTERASELLADTARHYQLRVADAWVPAYLTSRGLHGEAAHAHAGYAPPSWTSLVDHLRRTGYTDDAMIAAGVASRARTGNLIDRWRDRLMLPVHNADGHITGFIGRINPDTRDTAAPKYLNSPQTLTYSKGDLLYGLGLDGARAAAARFPIVVTEGPLDALAINAAGRATGSPMVGVAPCGTALTRQQATQLAQLAAGRPVTLAYDADAAGAEAIARANTQLINAGANRINAVELQAGQDPADYLKAGRPADLTHRIAHARPAAWVLTDQTLAQGTAEQGDNMVWRIVMMRQLVNEHVAHLLPELHTPYLDHVAQQLDLPVGEVYVHGAEAVAAAVHSASPVEVPDRLSQTPTSTATLRA